MLARTLYRWPAVLIAYSIACGTPRAPDYLTPSSPSVVPTDAGSDAPDAARVVDTRGWASAADSPYKPFQNLRPECLIDHGCPFEPAVLPPCPSGLDPLDVTEVLARADELSGQSALVRGMLRARTMMTLVDCGFQCCNSAGGPIVLSSLESSEQGMPPSLLLADEANPYAFRCGGDDSWTCCTFSPNVEVLVYGRIEPIPPERLKYHLVYPSLTDVRLCALHPFPPPAELEVNETGCKLQGRQYAPEEHVTIGEQMCGCHRGRASCQPNDSSSCFYAGEWLPDKGALLLRRSCEVLQCNSGNWARSPGDCSFPMLALVGFALRSTALEPKEAAKLEPLPQALRELPGSIRIIARVKANEGRNAEQLAQERAQQVKRWLVRHGVSPEALRVEIKRPEIDDGGPPLVHFRFVPQSRASAPRPGP
ncbi:OmpA family protein [Polyangium sorediatum]|uniref:OmpA family protein n=1 Tax=Polyangium sorediatum TaxID=889274 RepID=A0ABT6P2A2_9BACT|nr:OmpA family protein [Polyangium sorediatum]MDI1434740.1 OmpA family protein [Polyangium sorediatum]